MQCLYEMDATGHDPYRTLARLAEEESLSASALPFANELLKGVLTQRHGIDDLIGRYARQFPVEQMAAVDRNLLRIAIFEILFHNKTPPKAVINEAVELAKRFGSAHSSSFINGVLGNLMAAIPGSRTIHQVTSGR